MLQFLVPAVMCLTGQKGVLASLRAVTKVFFSVHTKCTLKVLSITLILKCFFLLTVSLSYDVDQAPFN